MKNIRAKDIIRALPCSVLIITLNNYRAAESEEAKKAIINDYLRMKKQIIKITFKSLFNRSEIK